MAIRQLAGMGKKDLAEPAAIIMLQDLSDKMFYWIRA